MQNTHTLRYDTCMHVTQPSRGEEIVDTYMHMHKIIYARPSIRVGWCELAEIPLLIPRWSFHARPGIELCCPPIHQEHAQAYTRTRTYDQSEEREGVITTTIVIALYTTVEDWYSSNHSPLFTKGGEEKNILEQ